MPHSFGYRARTRYVFAKDFRKHGPLNTTTYLNEYKMGDYVDIKGDGSIQKGMPHRQYHGRTGRIFSVTKATIGIKIKKRVRHRYIEKLIYVRFQHVKPSRCNEEFKERTKKLNQLRQLAAKEGKKFPFKRVPEQPRQAHIVSTEGNKPITITPIPYETLI